MGTLVGDPRLLPRLCVPPVSRRNAEKAGTKMVGARNERE